MQEKSAGSAQTLREQHCDAIQGHYAAQALAPDEFAGMVARQRSTPGNIGVSRRAGVDFTRRHPS
jgi:hypothetical protein